jgi:hypothetical protein
VFAFAARVHGDPVQGMLRERRDQAGKLVNVTLFLRPYRTLGKAIEKMQALVSESPLPGRST